MQIREDYPAEVTQGLPDQYVPKLPLVIACFWPHYKDVWASFQQFLNRGLLKHSTLEQSDIAKFIPKCYAANCTIQGEISVQQNWVGVWRQ